MATIKIKFRPSTQDGKEGSLYYQVIHNRIVRQITSGYKLYPEEWNADEARIVNITGEEKRQVYLFSLEKCINKDVLKLKRIVARFEEHGHLFTVQDILNAYHSSWETDGFFSFARYLIEILNKAGHIRRAETYEAAINSFKRFYTNADEIPFEKIDTELMMCYEQSLKSSGLTFNTISFYMRNLRAVYNQAVEKELTPPKNPFKYVYTGVDKTMKRAVPLKNIQEIKELDLSAQKQLDFARDLFLFSFYTRGMSFIDMAFLKKNNLQNGILTYRRHKTGQRLSIKWEMPMQAIIDKYDTSETPYLLPVIKANGQDEWRQYRNASHLVNRKLKQVGMLLNLPVSLTLYVARHAWASIAKSKNIALSVISEAMGHDSEHTTRIYLASLDTSTVDMANSLILDSL